MDVIRLKPQVRFAQAEAGDINIADRTVQLSFSSETPVERFFGNEVLDHSRGAADLTRFNNGANVLVNHNPDDYVGVIEAANIGNDRRGHATIRFSKSDRANQIFADVQDGILRNVSFMYEINKVAENSDKNEYRVTSWTPMELSIVTIPADPSVGVGRANEQAEKEVRVTHSWVDPEKEAAAAYAAARLAGWKSAAEIRAEHALPNGVVLPMELQPPDEDIAERPPPNTEPETEPAAERAFFSPETAVRDAAISTTTVVDNPAAPAAVRSIAMSDVQTAAAGTADPKVYPNAVQIEKERRDAINKLCEASNVDNRVKEAWIERGLSLEQISSEFLAYMQERGKKDPVVASSVGMSTRDTQRYSLFRAIRALHFGGRNPTFMSEAAFEIECSNQVGKQLGRETTASILVPGEVLQRSVGKEAATRAMSTIPGSKGGYAVPIDQMGFIDILRNRSVAMRMGARVLSGLQGNVAFPRQTGKVSVTWQAGEGTSVTAADQALGQLSMTPKTCIAITDVSEQLLRQMSPSAESFIMADLAADVAIDGVDNAAINGTGGAQPLGIKNTTGVTTGQDAASATYAKVLAFVSTAGGSNAIRGNPGFLTNTAGAAKLMQVQRFTSTDTPVWEGTMLDGTLVGFNAMSSEQLASGNLIFGSFDELVIGEWGVLELSTDNGGTRFNQAQIGVRAMWMVDVMLRYPQAFVVSTNLS